VTAFKIAKTEFLRGLKLAKGAADRKHTMAVLGNVQIKAHGAGGLTISATDLNVSVTVELKSDNSAEGGLLISAGDIYEVVSNAPGDEVTVARTEASGLTQIQSGKAKYKLVSMPDKDFPVIHQPPASDEFSAVNSAALREMIDRVTPSICTDETRFAMTGVLFESSGSEIRMVSTDGHRLSKVARPGAVRMKKSAIIPKKGLVELKRLSEQGAVVALAFKAQHVFAVQDNVTVGIKLIDLDYPSYDGVVPKDHQNSATVNRERLMDAMRRLQFMSTEMRGIRVELGSSSLAVSCNNPDLGEVSDEVDAEVTGSVIFGINPKFVAELLGQMTSDQVVMRVGGPLDPVMFHPLTGDDYLGIIMPMRAD
jgi:DNA polymerase-3 subunit beta